MPCIYAIHHKHTQFGYVGCTKGKLAKRMREHRCILKSGNHASTMLQKDWDRDGEESFEIVVLEMLSLNITVSDKRARKLYWMQVYGNKLYNTNVTSFAPSKIAIERGVKASAILRKGTKNTPESNEKRRLAQLGKPKRPGQGAKISATKRALGQKPSLEAARKGGIVACKKRYGPKV